MRYVLLLLIVVLAKPVFAENYPPLKRLRILALADTAQYDLKESIKVDFENLNAWRKSLFQNDAFPELEGKSTLHYYGVNGSKITPADIDYYFKHYPIKSDEAFMLYYSGHGAYNSSRFTEGQYLAMSGGDIGVANIFFKANAPLSIMVVDACSSYPEPMTAGCASAGGDSLTSSDVRRIQKSVKSLFLNGRGVVSLRASSPGEFAWSNSRVGGHFTNVLFNQVISVDGILAKAKSTGKLAYWTTVAKDTRALVTERFQDIKSRNLDLYHDQSEYGSLSQDEKAAVKEILGTQNQTVYYYNNVFFSAENRIFRRFYTPWKYNAAKKRTERKIAVYYGLVGIENKKVDVRGYYHYDDNQPVIYNSGNSSTPLSTRTSFVGNHYSGYGTIGLIDDKTSLNGFPKKKYKMIFQISTDGKLLTESNYLEFGNW